jgi:LPS export ABC transporter protein LptC/lipopolysaccharide transport protein LptA
MENPIAEKIKIQTNAKKRRREAFVDFWAKLPAALKVTSAFVLILTFAAIGAGIYHSRNIQNFVLKGGKPELSMNVVAIVENYERRVTNKDKLQLLVRADRETTYEDGRHELENIFLENYAADSEKPDRVSAAKAVYMPSAENAENFTATFSGNVNFQSRDGLKAQTEEIIYDRAKEFAETASPITFERENIRGSAIGAKLSIAEKRLDLQNQVEINVAPGDAATATKNSLNDFGNSEIKIKAARASLDQNLEQFELESGVNILITPQNEQNAQTIIRAEKAVYKKDSQVLDLSGGVEIVSAASDNAGAIGKTKVQKTNSVVVPLKTRADAVTYRQGEGKIYLSGNSSVEQGGDLMSGETITCDLTKQKKIEKAQTRGRAFLRTVTDARTTEISAAEMSFFFDKNQQIQSASATGGVFVKSASGENLIRLNDADSLWLNFKSSKQKSLLEELRAEGNTNVILTSDNNSNYSSVQMLAPNWTEVLFAASGEQSVLKQMTTGGRTTVILNAPASQNQNPKAANKKLIADSLKLFWNAAGKDLLRAEASGNAELYLVPLGAGGADIDRQSVFASRFDCDFYETGNLIKTAAANGKAKAVLEPTEPNGERGTRNLTADKMIASFERQTQFVEIFNAAGNAKFNESDRNALANNFTYTAVDNIVRLRGGEPCVWDSRARLKAAEIDLDRAKDISYLRGKVATTYYSQEQTGGAAPFGKVNSPVFIVSNQAEFNHKTGVAVYTGNARAWQDENFVRAEKIILRRDTKSMFCEGAVQSALYNAKRRENGKESNAPVFAAAERMNYSDEDKLLRYEGGVDIRQGTDRINGGAAEVYLNARNEAEKTIAENSVIITQPGRKAKGDWAQYTSENGVVILKGNPAIVEDVAQGASQGRQLTVYLRENRVEGQGGAKPNSPGRVRTTHKIN